MTTPKDWRANTEGDDWFRTQEKAQIHAERRPQIHRASDLLGPGLGAFAMTLDDWNAEAAMFNGLWVATDAANSPGTGTWFGLTIGTVDGQVMQYAANPVPEGGGSVLMRLIETNGVGVRTFHPWGAVI